MASFGTEFFRRASGLRMWGALSWGKLSGGVFLESGASCHLKMGRHVLWLFRLSNFVVDQCVCFAGVARSIPRFSGLSDETLNQGPVSI